MTIVDPVEEDMTQSRTPVSENEWKRITERAGLDMPEVGKDQRYPRHWQSIIGTLVALDAIFLGITINETRPANSDLSDTEKLAITIIENCFCVAWIGEMVVRLTRDRWRYFLDLMNLVDFSLVWLGVFSVWVAPYGLPESVLRSRVLGMDVASFLSTFRIFKLLRLLKLMKMFRSLWDLITGALSAMKQLFWVIVLLMTLVYAGGVYVTLLIGYQCGTTYSEWEACDEHFGTVQQSMYSLFQVMTFESWSTVIVRPVLQEKVYMIVFFLAFMAVTSFGLMNIIVGIVVENTLEAANAQREREHREEQSRMRSQLEALRTLFEEADEDGSGCVDLQEFVEIMSRTEVQAKMKELDLPYDFPEKLFECLDQDGSGEITIDEFVDGSLALTSDVNSRDMRTAIFQISSMSNKLSKVEGALALLCQDLVADDDGAPVVGVKPDLTTHSDFLPPLSSRSDGHSPPLSPRTSFDASDAADSTFSPFGSAHARSVRGEPAPMATPRLELPRPILASSPPMPPSPREVVAGPPSAWRASPSGALGNAIQDIVAEWHGEAHASAKGDHQRKRQGRHRRVGEPVACASESRIAALETSSAALEKSVGLCVRVVEELRDAMLEAKQSFGHSQETEFGLPNADLVNGGG